MEAQYPLHHYDPRLRRELEIIDVVVALVIVGLCIISLLNYNSIKTGIEASIQAYGFVGLFLIVSFLEFIPQFINPVVTVWAATLLGFNFLSTILIAITASSFGSILGFEIGKRYGFKYALKFFEIKTLSRLMAFWSRYGKAFVFASAITPLPYIPILFGSLKMARRDFLLFGLIPRFFNYLILGYLFHFGFWNLLV